MKSFTKVETWTIKELMDTFKDNPTMKRKTIIPKYQRNLVWSEAKKKTLIDSIKKGLPIGAILLYNQGSDGSGNNNFQLIDGLQRSTSIRSYIDSPTTFISSDDLPQNLISDVREFLVDKGILYEETKVSDIIVNWIRSLTGFNETEGFSSSRLANTIDEKTGDKLNKKELRDLTELLVNALDQIKISSDISQTDLPIIIYSGPKGNLPQIFERLNSQGVQLTKYQVFAATWSAYNPIKLKNTQVIDKIKLKYDALIEEGLEIDNYDPVEIYSSDLNYFEIFFGFGKLLAEKFPSIFRNSSKDDETDSLGFVVASLCVEHDLRKMGDLPYKLKGISDFDIFLEKIEDATYEAHNILKPYIGLRANKKNGSDFPIPHTELQISSIVAKIFNSKYLPDLSENPEWNKIKDELKRYLPFHYLYDILRGYWSGTGDAKALEVSSRDSQRYMTPISRGTWNLILNELFEDELEKKERKRINIKNEIILFFKFIYSHLLSAHEELSTTEFEIEHLVPFSPLKDIALKSEINGLPISAFPNLCLIKKSINRDKGNKTIYQYYNQEVSSGQMTPDQANDEIQKIERLTFTTRKDLIFVENLDVKNIKEYYKFLENRKTTVIEKFLDLNKIK